MRDEGEKGETQSFRIVSSDVYFPTTDAISSIAT